MEPGTLPSVPLSLRGRSIFFLLVEPLSPLPSFHGEAPAAFPHLLLISFMSRSGFPGIHFSSPSSFAGEISYGRRNRCSLTFPLRTLLFLRILRVVSEIFQFFRNEASGHPIFDALLLADFPVPSSEWFPTTMSCPPLSPCLRMIFSRIGVDPLFDSVSFECFRLRALGTRILFGVFSDFCDPFLLWIFL